MYLTVDEIATKNDCEIKKCAIGDDVNCCIKVSYKKEENFFNFFMKLENGMENIKIKKYIF